MKFKTFKSGLIVSLVFVSVNCRSQIIWSLEDCISYAYENNITIRQQQLSVNVAKAELDQSKYEFLPDLNAGLNYTYISNNALNPATNRMEVHQLNDGIIGITSNLVLFDGFKQYNTISKKKSELMQSQASVEKLRSDITLVIVSAYLQILLSKENVEVAEGQLQITDQHVRRMEKMVEVGSSEKGQLLDIRAQKAIDNMRLTNAKNQLEISQLALVQLLNLDSVGSINIKVPDKLNIKETPLPDMDSLFRVALERLPHIKYAEYNVNSSKKALAISKSYLYPNLSLRYNYYLTKNAAIFPTEQFPITLPQNSPVSGNFGDNRYRSISLNLKVPIYNKGQINKNISLAKIAFTNSEYHLEEIKQILYKEIQQAYIDATAALAKYKSAAEAVISTEEAFNYTQQKYTLGYVGITEFNDARNNYIRTKSELTQSKYDYILKTKILDFYIGLPIKL